MTQRKRASKKPIAPLLRRSLKALGCTIPKEQLRELEELIEHTAHLPERYFHGPEHFLHVASKGDPIAVIAALFHDLVYLQIDGHLPFAVAYRLEPFLESENGKFRLRHALPAHCPVAAEAVIELFGLKPGMWLDTGINEFLSALTMALLLSDSLPLKNVIEIAACIELTIPFRHLVTAKKNMPSDRIRARILKLHKRLALDWTDAHVERVVRRAVDLANLDIANFADARTVEFLRQTWILLPETTPALRDPSNHDRSAYFHALHKMEKFLGNLKAETVFQQFGSHPSDDVLEKWVTQAQHNIKSAHRYFRVKIVALATLSALDDATHAHGFALGSSGEIPGTPFRNPEDHSDVLDKLLALAPPPKALGEFGTILMPPADPDSRFALPRSSFAFVMWSTLGAEAVTRLWKPAIEFLEGERSAGDYLRKVPAHFLKSVTVVLSESLGQLVERWGAFIAGLR